MKLFCSAALLLALAGCTATPPASQAQQADNAACTAQANAQYQQNTQDLQARPPQVGQRYGAMPTQVFNAERMGALNERANQITQCEETGSNNGQPQTNGFTPVAPHIITN